MNSSIVPYTGSKGALKNLISRVEQNNLYDLSIPNEHRDTLTGAQFLLKETNIADDKILLFSTCFNLKKLGDAILFILSGTFKTVPTVLKQLYTIHAPSGSHKRSRASPLVCANVTKKHKMLYTIIP